MSAAMPTVREMVYELLREQGINKIFGNPGSNEINFLKDFPEDFEYILCLHEGVAVGMADGYAQASGKASFVNLHSASGTGNAMGALTNSYNAHSPVVVTAGQQARSLVYTDPLLKNTAANLLPMPLVKVSYEPLSPEEVPHVVSRAMHAAMAPARGPVYVSIPYDDWDKPVTRDSLPLPHRLVQHCGEASAEVVERLVSQLQQAKNPVLIFGPEVDQQRANAIGAQLAEKVQAPAWVAPSAPRCPFPTTHPCFAGILPAGIASLSQKLEGHDLVLVFGAPVFRYHQNDPGAHLPKDCELILVTGDYQEAARAPVGNAIVANVGSVLKDLVRVLPEKSREKVNYNPVIQRHKVDDTALCSESVFDIVESLKQENTVYLNEATSTIATLWERGGMTEPGSYYFAASGGLGFAMPAALGVKLAQPDRPVVAFVGDGSAHYNITALWTATHYNIPVVFIIINNKGYKALQQFVESFKVNEIPGLKVDGVDFVSLAKGYAVEACQAKTKREFKEAFEKALQHNGPFLIDAQVEAI